MFRSGSPARRVRLPFVRVGVNDAVQLGAGWWEPEHWPDGPMRWTRFRAEAFMRASGGERRVKLLVCGGPSSRGVDPEMRVRVDAALSATPIEVSASAPRGSWTWLDVTLPAALSAGEVKVTIEAPTFVPAGGASGDTRELGVGVRELLTLP